MTSFKSLARTMILSLALVGAVMPIAHAAVTPDPAANPILANILKMGAKMYYLGQRDGLDGWFIVKDGRVQFAYATADKKAVLIGTMFGENGDSVTGAQVRALAENNKEISALMENATAPVGSTPVTPVMPTTTTLPPLATPAAVQLSPGERLYQDLSNATGVTLGNSKSQILMVMDVNCPHCQATWRMLRDAVMKNTVQLRMIPIEPSDSDSERAAGQLLHSADPLTVWDKYVGADKASGDKTQLAGVQDAATTAATQNALKANHVLIDSWKIDQTPYMVYRGKDGKVKIVMGEPEKIAVILNDLAP